MLYRTTDNTKWGAGKEARLTKLEIDNNFWEIITRLVAVEGNAPQPNEISNITLTGSQLSIHLEDGTIFGPYTLPVAVMRFRGNWAATIEYFELDIVNVIGEGLFLVLRDHIAAEVFDPAAATAEGGLYYHQIMPADVGGGLEGVEDVDLGADSTLRLGVDHANKYLRFSSSTTFSTFTIYTPDDVDADIAIGTQIWLENNDATREMRIASWDINTINGYNWEEFYTITKRYSVVVLTKVAANTWSLVEFIKPLSTADPIEVSIGEAPIDGNPYVRWDGSWQVMPIVTVTWADVASKPALIEALPSTVGNDGQVLKASGGAVVWGADETGGTSGATSLDKLNDVDVSTVSPTDGQVLVFDITSGLWLPNTISTGGGGGNGGGGLIAQVVNMQTGEYASGTTQIPVDDTIPQNTEGDEYMTLAITPKNANSILKIEVTGIFGCSDAGRWLAVALFKDADVDAIAVGSAYIGSTGGGTSLHFAHCIAAGSVNEIVFKVRAGIHSSGTTTFNGGATRHYGGVQTSSIVITEILPEAASNVATTISYTGTRTLELADAEQYLRCIDDVNSSLIVPLNSVVPFPLNTTIHHRTAGTGKVTIEPSDVNITVNPPFGQTLVTPGAGATISLFQTAIDEWDIIGHTEVAV